MNPFAEPTFAKDVLNVEEVVSKQGFSVLGDSIVTLRIEMLDGKVETAHVHEKLLCTASPVFKAALGGGFAEASTKTVTVVDVNATTIDDFLYWLYHEKCKSTQELMRYGNLNKFADMYDIAWLKYDTALATLITVRNLHDPQARLSSIIPIVGVVYASTRRGDDFRKLLVAVYVHTVGLSHSSNSECYKTEDNVICLYSCSEYAAEVALEMSSRAGNAYRYISLDASMLTKPGAKPALESENKVDDIEAANADINAPNLIGKRRRKEYYQSRG